MQVLLDEWSIVIVGSWNTRIFTPQWVRQNIFRTDEVKLEVSLVPRTGVRYSQADITVAAGEERLVFAPLMAEDQALRRLEDSALLVLEKLPHTPITAVGINFGYADLEPEDALLSHFSLADSAAISRAGYAVQEAAIRRHLAFDGHLMNLMLAHATDGRVLVTLNFHTDVSNAEAAKDAIRGQVMGLRERSVDLLRKVYNATLTET